MNRSLEIAGGLPCLDFVNTVGWRATDEPEERLHSYMDLLHWSERTGIVSRAHSGRLQRLASERERAAKKVLLQARTLRETLFRLLTAFRTGRPPAGGDLEAMNEALARMPARRRIAHRRRGFTWDLEDGNRLDVVLWTVLWSASDLLVGNEPSRVKSCAGKGCGWLFYDTSRNRSRRWCSMSDCGNRAKARRHYQKLKTKGTVTAPKPKRW